jgi:hypothetical protein
LGLQPSVLLQELSVPHVFIEPPLLVPHALVLHELSSVQVLETLQKLPEVHELLTSQSSDPAQVLVDVHVSCCVHILAVTQSLVAWQVLTPVQLLPDWQVNVTGQVLLPVHENCEGHVSVVEQPGGGLFSASAGPGAARSIKPPMPTATTIRVILPTNCRRVAHAGASGGDCCIDGFGADRRPSGAGEESRTGC